MIRHSRFIRRIRILFYTVLGLSAIGIFSFIVAFFMLLDELPRVPDPLSRIIERPPTEIYAATGERVLVLGGREAVPLNRISPRFIEAIVAIEDHRFWSHHGIDKIRLTKAFLDGLTGKPIRATSTITQQLAKNLFFTLDRSIKRKFLEALVAFQIESKHSKEDILEAYINNTSFGVNALGIEQASRSFFGKPASDLTLAEASLLAGLPQSPSGHNPYRHMDSAKIRQRSVLRSMAAVGYISQEEADAAYEEPLDLRPRQASTGGGYFLDTIIQELEKRYGPEVVYNGGLQVTTTLDKQLQRWATEAVQKGAARLDKEIGLSEEDSDSGNDVPQAALAAIDVNSGAVKALVGGRDYIKSQYNRAIHDNRLPGSGFKPFLYYTALDSLGMTPATVLTDKEITIPINGAPDWTPSNFSNTFTGQPMTLKRALMDSVNSIAAQLIEKTGPAKVIDTARRCGITSDLESVYSIALGTSGVSPLEMASAFGVFASGGIRHEPFRIWRVEDAFGRVLEEHIISGELFLAPETVFQLVDMMRIVDAGTASVVRSMGFSLPAAGKTGTTNDYYDAWFTGFTPSLSVSVWTGYDTNRRLQYKNGVGITGGRAAAPIWADFMIKATGGEPAREFNVPPGIHFETVDGITGYPTEEGALNALRVALKTGQNPDPPPPTLFNLPSDMENENPSEGGLD